MRLKELCDRFRVLSTYSTKTKHAVSKQIDVTSAYHISSKKNVIIKNKETLSNYVEVLFLCSTNLFVGEASSYYNLILLETEVNQCINQRQKYK